jgi:arylsulfatase A
MRSCVSIPALCVALLAMFAVPHGAIAAGTAKRPNIVVILVDDFGYECIGADGSTSYKTPAVDKLAAGGVRFDYGFAQPLCTPTRVQLMTGMYNVRNYVHFGLLDPQQTTFANLFQQAGYATCIAGKWQLGHDFALPKHFGFDEYCLWQLTRRPERYKNPGLEINGREIDYTHGEYGPELVNNYALDFIARKKDHPFLLYYPMMLTHDPHVATPDSPDWNESEPAAKGKGKGKGEGKGEGKGKKNTGDKQRHFAEMTAYMDKMVGRLVAKLDECGIRDNTLILFTGDNGTGQGVRSHLGDRVVEGGKSKSNDAGMRVPLIVNWPAQARAGHVVRDLVDMTDVLPTICAAAGITVPSNLTIDGHSFLPQVRGEKGEPRAWTYCWYSPGGGTKSATEFARNHDYRLDRNGSMSDIRGGDGHIVPLKAGQLSPEAEQARRVLQGALDIYANARPRRLASDDDKPGAKE